MTPTICACAIFTYFCLYYLTSGISFLLSGSHSPHLESPREFNRREAVFATNLMGWHGQCHWLACTVHFACRPPRASPPTQTHPCHPQTRSSRHRREPSNDRQHQPPRIAKVSPCPAPCEQPHPPSMSVIWDRPRRRFPDPVHLHGSLILKQRYNIWLIYHVVTSNDIKTTILRTYDSIFRVRWYSPPPAPSIFRFLVNIDKPGHPTGRGH
jgi:hypothetical protein